MEGERKRSKGGFFHLFDWNGKSRKKLFANNLEFPEGLKQEKENVELPAKLQHQVVEVGGKRANLGNRANTDLSSASSVASDEGYGARAPGVVARLMGLDTLPTSSAAETASTPFFDSNFLKASPYDKSSPSFWGEGDSIGHLNVPNNQEKHHRPCPSLEPKTAKSHNRPIKRFQTEVLPPKSAKSISVTQHKLLSPVRNHGFIQEKKAAYIVEAAAKIIEASPKAASNNKIPSIGSSSVPLRIHDLKQKMEAAHTASRPQRSDTSSSTNTRGQLIERNLSGSEGMSSSRVSMFSEKGTSNGLKNKGKLIPLAVQATTNARRKEGYSSRSDNNKQKDQLRKTNQSVGKKAAQQRNFEKSNNVLRPNNVKQNSVSNRDGSTLKNSSSNQERNKVQSTKSCLGPSRTLNKVVVKPETTSRRMDSVKERTKSLSWKRKTVNGDLHGEAVVSSAVSADKNDSLMNGVIAIDGCVNATTDNKKNGLDIVSFTFMSPIKKAMSDSPPSGQMRENFNAYNIVHDSNGDHAHMKSGTSYFPGLAAIGGDALSVLLEQKLKELTTKIDPSYCNVIKEESCTSSISRLPNTVCKLDPCLTTSPVVQDSMAQVVTNERKSGAQNGIDCNSVEYLRLAYNQKWQRLEEMEEHSSSSSSNGNGYGYGKEVECQHPSFGSTLEPSLTCESFSNDSKVFDGISTSESLEADFDTELSDSASSICTTDVIRKHIIVTSTMTESREASEWELHYMRNVLNNAELHLQEFVSGQMDNVITPHLFHQLESQDYTIEKNEEDYSKIGRKLLFDCISERLEFMCGQVFVGSCKSWAKLGTLSQRKGLLTVEICKEILDWKSMGDSMVDELVEKDMSTQCGKWLDFSIEAFEEGREIEKGILTCLIDELVYDLLM